MDNLLADPFAQFQAWYAEASKMEKQADAMVLSTQSADGWPTSRVILFKGLDESGFFFVTNYLSPKAVHLLGNPRASLVFHWPVLNRQVRILGTAKKASFEESDRYFQSRPRESQLSAWASPQSQKISSREFLEHEAHELDKKFSGKIIPRPPNWGGFRLMPSIFEFWIGREARLHDRILYEKSASGSWQISRLAP